MQSTVWLHLLTSTTCLYNLRPFQNILLCPALTVLMTRGGDVLYCHPNSFCSAATGSLGCPAVPTILQPNTTACQIGSLLHVLSSDRSISSVHLKLCWEFYMNTFPSISCWWSLNITCTQTGHVKKSLCCVQNETWSQMRSKVRLLQTPLVITCTFQWLRNTLPVMSHTMFRLWYFGSVSVILCILWPRHIFNQTDWWHH